jgi:hypothetical protein
MVSSAHSSKPIPNLVIDLKRKEKKNKIDRKKDFQKKNIADCLFS